MDSIHMIALSSSWSREGKKADNNNFLHCLVAKKSRSREKSNNGSFLQTRTDFLYCEKWRQSYWQQQRTRSVTRLPFLSSSFLLLDVRSFILNRISIESSYFHSHSLFFRFGFPSLRNLLYCFDRFSLRFIFLSFRCAMISLTHMREGWKYHLMGELRGC